MAAGDTDAQNGTEDAAEGGGRALLVRYRGTWLIRNNTPLGLPYDHRNRSTEES